MKPTLVEGVDPGLVHTGVVSMLFVPEVRKIVVSHHLVLGPDERQVANWLRSQRPAAIPPARTFIEAYNPRAKFNNDKQMVEALQRFRKELPRATVLNNTGVKKVVKRPLMELLGVWKFSTSTNHQDLRSAARIALLGMLKDPETNSLVTDIVVDFINGKDWYVELR